MQYRTVKEIEDAVKRINNRDLYIEDSWVENKMVVIQLSTGTRIKINKW